MAQNLPLGELPATGYIRRAQLIPGILPFSAATLRRMIKAGSFPAPVKLSPRLIGWPVESVRSWMLARDATEPVKRQQTSESPSHGG